MPLVSAAMTTHTPTLFDPLRVGDIELATRLVMAPLTRNRAGAGNVPTPLMAEYYAQRANPATGAGLLITEATPISPQGHGYQDTPGIHSAEQVEGWKAVTRAVQASSLVPHGDPYLVESVHHHT